MIRVGIVGLGFMGWIHWLAYQRLPGVHVTAVCDRKPPRLQGDWRAVRGNFGPPGEKVNLGGAIGCLDWRDLIRNPDIDLVDITLPTVLHADVTIAALGAGKHVLCEKPMALSADDCEKMLSAAEDSGRQLFVAHVLPFFPEYEWGLGLVRSGKYGPLIGGSFKRVISDPTWIKNYWSADVCGPMFDLHVHDAHYVRLLFGQPASVIARGRLRDGFPEFWQVSFDYPDRNVLVEASCGVMNQPDQSFDHAFAIQLEGATLEFEYAVLRDQGQYLCEPTIYDLRAGVQRQPVRSGDPLDAFVAELQEATRCIRDGRRSELLDATLARDAVRICEAEAVSMKTGKTARI